MKKTGEKRFEQAAQTLGFQYFLISVPRHDEEFPGGCSNSISRDSVVFAMMEQDIVGSPLKSFVPTFHLVNLIKKL
jgi:hypothetical protein